MRISAIFPILIASILTLSSEMVLAEVVVPEGFEIQPLDVTKGQVFKPKGWFYNFSGNEQSIVWTISKEDSKKGSYKTGMRIQFSPSIKSFTEESPRDVIAGIIRQKTKSVKVDRLCNEERAGEFQRICLETTEPTNNPKENFKILYTFSWSQEKSAIVITIFGAPESEWNSLKGTIETMSKMTLIGADFWTEK